MKLSININAIILVLITSPFLFTPFDGLKRLVILTALLGLWVFSSISLNHKAMYSTLPLFITLFFLMFLQWFYSEMTGDHDQFRRFFTQNLWTYIWAVFGVYYSANISVFKKSIPFIAIMLLISCAYTIVGNLAIPGASRMLAGSEGEGSQMYEIIHAMNVGGYGFIYALVFAIIPCTLWIKYRFSKRIIAFILLGFMFGTLLVGSYFTSIVLATLALTISLSNTKNISSFVIVFSILFLFVLFFNENLLRGLYNIGVMIDSPMLQTRAQQMLDGTYQEAYESAGDYSRWDRALNALHNIAQSPIWGKMTTDNLDLRPSGHSEFLGYFERFGIFALIQMYYFYYIYKQIKKQALTKEMRLRINIFFAFFLVFLCVNTFDTANTTGCMAFFLAPCTMLYIESINDQNKKKIV